jgi:DNA-binding transcriptional regulator YhcF (GntR family)
MNGAIYGRIVSSVPKQRRRRLVMSFEMVRLDRASSEPLHQQLYRQIREELESGSFDSSASRVPSSRVLAATLGISRPTVNQAFSKLLAEGYLCDANLGRFGRFTEYRANDKGCQQCD